MLGQRRIEWLDFAKGLTIFLVILAHCMAELLQPEFKATYISYWNKILNYILFIFIMPLFFSISGYLYKRIIYLRSFLLLIYKKFISLMIPYFLFSSFITFSKDLLGYKEFLYYIFLGYKTSIFLWFLPALFLIFIIIGLLDLLNVNLIAQICLVIILLVSRPKFYNIFNSPFNMRYMVLSYILFFYLGIIIKNYLIKYIKCFNKICFLNIILLISLLVYQLTYTGVYYQTNVITFIDIFTKILFVFVFYSLFINFHHNAVFKYFARYGKMSLVIYLIHHPVITILSYILRRNIIIRQLSFTWYCILIFILVWIISDFICVLCKRIKIINFIFYPRNYINKFVMNTNLGKYLINN